MAEDDSSASLPDAHSLSNISDTKPRDLQSNTSVEDPQTQTDDDQFDVFKVLGQPQGKLISNRPDNIIYMIDNGICMRLADDPLKSARLVAETPCEFIHLLGLLKLAGFEDYTPATEIPDVIFDELKTRYWIVKAFFNRNNRTGKFPKQPWVYILHVDDAEQLSKDLGIYNTCRQYFHAVRNLPPPRMGTQCGICALHWDRRRMSFCFWSMVHCKHGRNIPWKDLVYRVCSCGFAFVTVNDFKAHLAEEECFNFDG